MNHIVQGSSISTLTLQDKIGRSPAHLSCSVLTILTLGDLEVAQQQPQEIETPHTHPTHKHGVWEHREELNC